MLKYLKFLNDNHWLLIFGCICLCMFFWLYGCESHVKSILEPEKEITRAELENEVNSIMAIAQTKLSDLDKQDEVRQLILDKAALFATTGTFNPTGLLNLIISIGAIGTTLDSRRKLKVTTAKVKELLSDSSQSPSS